MTQKTQIPGITTAIRAETRKFRRSLVGIVGTLALVIGTLALLAGITAGVASGNPELKAKAGPAAVLNWSGLLSGAAQITAAGGLIGFGVVLAWIVGREFTEGTISGLFGLPVSRGHIALAKLIVYALWALVVGTVLALGILVLGLGMQYGVPDAESWRGLGRQWVLTVLTAGLVTPVAWLATVTRSVLAAVGGAIGVTILSQVGALAGAGGWLPFAAPALWSMSGGTEVNVIQLALPVVVALIGAGATWAAWSRLELDR